MIELEAENNEIHLPIINRQIIPLEFYTCHKCGAKDNCQYAWDDYNINGDCLAEK